MKGISTADISRLRSMTGVGMVTAKKALESTNGDFIKAIEALRKSGEKIAASKAGRSMGEGRIGHYIHANGKIASLVVVTCETDFVARSEAFQELVHDLALHIAAANPQYRKPEDVPADVIAQEREIYRAQIQGSGKQPVITEKIIDGKLEKYYAETCLYRQQFVKDEQLTIEQLIVGVIQKLGENIDVREFIRFNL